MIPLYKTNVIIPIFKARTGPFRISVLSKYVPSPSQTYRHGRCRRIAVGLLRQRRRRKPPRKRVCPGRHDRSRLQRFGRRGGTFDSPEGFAGRTTLLLFFATWCPDCQAELPVIDAVWQTVAGEPGYDVVAISRGGAEGRYEQSPDILSRYWKDHDLRMPWYLDGDRSVFDRFASAGIPRVYIVNAEGVVVWQSAAPELDAAGYLALLRQYR